MVRSPLTGFSTRPTTFVSIPVPEIFFPVSSRSSTSRLSEHNRGKCLQASLNSSGSRASISAAGIASTSMVWSYAFSTIAKPAITLHLPEPSVESSILRRATCCEASRWCGVDTLSMQCRKLFMQCFSFQCAVTTHSKHC